MRSSSTSSAAAKAETPGPGSVLDLNLVRFVNQEVVSKCSVESSAEDEGGCELCEGEVELGSSFPAGGDAAVVVEP